jgi:hypothetical protein
MSNQSIIEHRISELEDAVKTMAVAAKEQQTFNTEVTKFMTSVSTWGKAALLVYGITQSILILMLSTYISKG